MNVEIAQRLAARRKQAGLSQEALAEKLGVSRQAVSKWERSESSPDTDNLIALAQLYGVSLDDLLYVDEQTRDDMAFAASDKAASRGDEKTEGADCDESDAPEADKEAPRESATSGGSDEKKSGKAADVNVGFDGVHVVDGDDFVHVSWSEGVHVKDGKKGEEVHVGWDGIHVNDGKTRVDGPFRGGVEGEAVVINGERFDSWRDARDAFGHGEKHSFEKSWNLFPYPVIMLIAFFGLGFFCDLWGQAAFLFLTIPVYYLVGAAISKRRIMPMLAGAYPLAVVAYFCYQAFFLNAPHPAWAAFLTIPLVEWLLVSLSHWWKRRKRERKMEQDAPIDVKAEGLRGGGGAQGE